VDGRGAGGWRRCGAEPRERSRCLGPSADGRPADRRHGSDPCGPSRRAGIRLHRSGTLGARDVTVHRGIPITTPARTITDLARTLCGRPLEAVIDRADQRGLVNFDDLRAAGPTSLKAALSNYRPAPTRSALEEAFLTLCDDHGIERPETNAHIEHFEVDFVWRARRLIVEVDGYAYHRDPGAFERDRERDVVLTLAGWHVMRFTWTQITHRAAWVAAAVTGEASDGPQVSSRPWP
jgi:very-short-patch-repair endonuclease